MCIFLFADDPTPLECKVQDSQSVSFAAVYLVPGSELDTQQGLSKYLWNDID